MHRYPCRPQVIQASGSVDLARSVVVPLLTREAIDFLHSSGTAEERHLWVALGDGWTKCRWDNETSNRTNKYSEKKRDKLNTIRNKEKKKNWCRAGLQKSRVLCLQVGVAEGSLLPSLSAEVSWRLGASGAADGDDGSESRAGADSSGRESRQRRDPETRGGEAQTGPGGQGPGSPLHHQALAECVDVLLTVVFVFVLQSAVQRFPPADGYAFSNTSYKRMQILDQDTAMAAFKHAVSRHVDR